MIPIHLRKALAARVPVYIFRLRRYGEVWLARWRGERVAVKVRHFFVLFWHFIMVYCVRSLAMYLPVRY
jgi:hypothetical protein